MPVTTCPTANKPAFTLVEILVTTSVIGLLSGIVITAINPQKQITNAQVTRRAAVVKQVNDELERMIVANTDLAEEIPIGADNAIRLCTPGAASNLSGCTTEFETLFENVILNDDEGIGYDLDYPESYTEFVVYKKPGGKVTVGSIYPTDPDDEMPEPTESPCTEGGNPYVICNGETLFTVINNNPSGMYVLGRDIDLQNVARMPIDFFDGSFDGQGYAITNLYINNPTSRAGLFDQMYGSVSNLTISDATIIGNNSVGILASYVESFASVNNCHTSGTVVANSNGGGLVGFSRGSIANSTSNALVSATTHAGLLGGKMWQAPVNSDSPSGSIVSCSSVCNTMCNNGIRNLCGNMGP